MKSESESCSVVSDSLLSMDYTVHGILQARILEWVAIPFSRGSSQPRDQTTREAYFGVIGSAKIINKEKNLSNTSVK